MPVAVMTKTAQQQSSSRPAISKRNDSYANSNKEILLELSWIGCYLFASSTFQFTEKLIMVPVVEPASPELNQLEILAASTPTSFPSLLPAIHHWVTLALYVRSKGIHLSCLNITGLSTYRGQEGRIIVQLQGRTAWWLIFSQLVKSINLRTMTATDACT